MKKKLKRKNEALWLRFENHALNQGLSNNRLRKLSNMYNACMRAVDLETAERPEIEAFVNNLHKDVFKRLDSQKYSGLAKNDIKKFLKQFMKWYKGNNERYPENVSWIRTVVRKDERPIEKAIISRDEAMTLAKQFNKVEMRTLTLLIMNSAFRISEALSVRKKDITWEEFEGESCFWVYCPKSKTICRKVPLPWYTTEFSMFFGSEYFKSLAPEDLVFNVSYDYFNRALKKYSQKLFSKKISPHNLRHASLTIWSKDVDYFTLCEISGHSYSSKEPATYVRRSGQRLKQAVKKVYENENVEIRRELNALRRTVDLLTRAVYERQEMTTWMKTQMKDELGIELGVESVLQPSL